jgi:hypothetical protein
MRFEDAIAENLSRIGGYGVSKCGNKCHSLVESYPLHLLPSGLLAQLSRTVGEMD